MKRLFAWGLLGISGSGLAALLLGQTVFGQPDMKPLLPVPPSATKPADGTPLPIPLPPPLPMVDTKSPPAPMPIGDLKGIPEITLDPAPRIPAEPRVDMPIPTPSPLILPGTPPAVKPVPTPKNAPPTPIVPRPANLSYEVQPGKQQPSLQIEWKGPTSARINQPLPCQILVRNVSTTAAQNVIVRHQLASGTICKQSEPPTAHETGELVWNLGTIGPDQTRRIDLILQPGARGPVNCHATVTFTAVAGHLVQVREPQLAVKLTGPDKVVVGENVSLVFAISNPGDGAAEAVRLRMTLPEGLEHPRGKVIEFDVGSLAAKEVRNLQLVCLTKGSGTQKCTIHVTGDGGLNASDTAQVDLLMPKLDLAVSGPKLRYLDRPAVYVLKVSNPGNAPASNVEIQETIPAGFKFQQASNGGQYREQGRLVSWTIGELQPGQSKDVTVNLIPLEAGEHQIVAQAKAARGLHSEAEARLVVEGLPSLFIEVAHVDDPIEVGAETAYEIRLANTGTKTETNVEVVCTLPEQLEFKGAKCSTALKFRHEGRELVFEPLPRLAPKADMIYRVQVKGVAPGDIRFRTRVRADNLKEPVTREESTRIYSDDGPVRPATSVPPPAAPTVIPGPTPTPTPKSGRATIPAPTPLPMPAPLPATPPLPIPAPAILPTPTPLPLPLPGMP